MKHSRHWPLMRMLCWPLRSPFKASSWLPGGTFKSWRTADQSSCASLRSAGRSMPSQRRTRRPSNSAWVSLHLKLLIATGSNINATREYHQGAPITCMRLRTRVGAKGGRPQRGICKSGRSLRLRRTNRGAWFHQAPPRPRSRLRRAPTRLLYWPGSWHLREKRKPRS